MGLNEGKPSKKAFHEGANNAEGVGAKEASIPPFHTRFPWVLEKISEVVNEILWSLNHYQNTDLQWGIARVGSLETM